MKRLLSYAAIIFITMILINSVYSQNNGKKLLLTQSGIKLMNTFFSNYSEVSIKPFTKETLGDKELINFGVHHNYRNNEKLFVKTGKENQIKIKAAYVDESVMKFFGKKIQKHQSIDDVEYHSGWYFITESSGEVFIFSQIVNLYDNGNNIFTAAVNVYTAGSGWIGNVHGTEEEWKKSGEDDIPELTAVMNARLQKLTEKGKSRYILLEYSKIK